MRRVCLISSSYPSVCIDVFVVLGKMFSDWSVQYNPEGLQYTACVYLGFHYGQLSLSCSITFFLRYSYRKLRTMNEIRWC
jgi:hypothetical protein